MRVISAVLMMSAAVLLAQVIQDPNQLVNKKVVVQRVALCEPGTFTTNLNYAGKTGLVISAKAGKSYKFSNSVLSRMTPEARAMLED